MSPAPLVIVSNRLPVALDVDVDGVMSATTGGGGLVSALRPALTERGGMWIGWSGLGEEDAEPDAVQAALDAASTDAGYALRAVPLTSGQVKGYYRGFSNSLVWPLFHDRLAGLSFDPEHWQDYRDVSARFADVVMDAAPDDALVWIQDYHLMHLARDLRTRGFRGTLGWFLHIPFPGPDLFRRLPWREDLLLGLLSHDWIGLQRRNDRDNLMACAEQLLEGVERRADGDDVLVTHDGHTTRVVVQGIGIEAATWSERARSNEVAARVTALSAEGWGDLRIVLGVDRLDESKGLLERLRAWRLLLERAPALHERVQLVQLVVPSREKITRYKKLKRNLDRLVGEINGQFSTPSWSPVQHLYRRVDPVELTALYRLADVCVVSSIKDGMNLVAKEYCACQVGEPGALVLSEFAGACDRLGPHAWVINPHDQTGSADQILAALSAGPADREQRMDALRAEVHGRDVHAWVDALLGRSGPSLRESA